MSEVLQLLRAGGLPVWRPMLWIAIVGLIGVLLETAAMLVAVQIFGVLFDDNMDTVSIPGLTASIPTACALGLVAMLFSALLQFEAGRLTSRLSTRYLTHLRDGLLTSVNGATNRAQVNLGEGRLQELATSIAYQASLLPMRAAAMLTSAIATTALIIAAFAVEPLAAIALVASGLVLAIAMKPISAAASAAADRHTGRQGQLAEDVAAWSRRLSAFRSFGVEAAAALPIQDNIHRTSAELGSLRTVSNGAVVLYRSLTISLLIVLVAVAASTDRVDPIGATLVLVIVLRALTYSQQFNSARQVAFESLGPAREIRRSIDELVTAKRHRGVRVLESFESAALHDVGFSIGSSQILSGVNLQIARGDKIAVVGASGGGKTTLLEIIAGLREPTSGQIAVNGHRLGDIEPESWSATSALVTQESLLIRGDATDNVVFMRSKVGVDDAAGALRAVGLEDGKVDWRSEIGTSAASLSGGQSQRIGLARALSAEPQLLVLDEPTSALDASTESLVIDTLGRLPADTTIVLISHRPGPLALCNRFIRVENGSVEELPDRAAALRISDEQPLRSVSEQT